MAFEQKPNSGTLSRNENMREGKKDAEYSGSAFIGGVKYFVDAWVNEFKSGPNAGKKYFSIKFKPKQSGGSPSHQTQQAQKTQQTSPGNSDVPF